MYLFCCNLLVYLNEMGKWLNQIYSNKNWGCTVQHFYLQETLGYPS